MQLFFHSSPGLHGSPERDAAECVGGVNIQERPELPAAVDCHLLFPPREFPSVFVLNNSGIVVTFWSECVCVYVSVSVRPCSILAGMVVSHPLRPTQPATPHRALQSNSLLIGPLLSLFVLNLSSLFCLFFWSNLDATGSSEIILVLWAPVSGLPGLLQLIISALPWEMTQLEAIVIHSRRRTRRRRGGSRLQRCRCPPGWVVQNCDDDEEQTEKDWKRL